MDGGRAGLGWPAGGSGGRRGREWLRNGEEDDWEGMAGEKGLMLCKPSLHLVKDTEHAVC